MTVVISAIWVAVLLVAEAGGEMKVEPGKQVPEKLMVHVGGKEPNDVTIRYLLFVPKDYSASGKKWPMMLFLHGAGESSSDDLSKVKVHGPPKIVEKKPDFPFVLVSPQSPPPRMIVRAFDPEQLIQLVDHVAGELNIDPERIYVTGLSMGGYGTWRLAAAYPERFAAAVPICGGGEPERLAKALSKVPIWAFHGAKDNVVPPSESEKMVEAVKRAGGDVKLTIYPDANHNSWEATYDNPKVYEWLLEHRRKGSGREQ